MSETATDKLSKRWESKRVHTSDNLTSRWDRNTDDRTLERPERPERCGSRGGRRNLKERVVSIREDVVGRIIGARGSNIRAMEEEISKKEGGMCKIHSVKGFGGGAFIVKGSHEGILDVAERWLKNYQEEQELKDGYEKEEREKEEARRKQLRAPSMDSKNFPSFHKDEGVSTEAVNPKWGECDSLRNAIHGLKDRKKKEEESKNWYPDSMVLLPLDKPVKFY